MKTNDQTMNRFLPIEQIMLVIPKRLLIASELVMFGVTFMDIFDWITRGATAIVTVLVGYWAIKAYRKKLKLDDLDEQIKMEQLHKLKSERNDSSSN